ncbi:dethiobiotin synthase [Alteromonadaceae bacterium BrNp21-10]|nr:dethiobiotin synthase [Alteromonadaceae bacterium BrNp21-10]
MATSRTDMHSLFITATDTDAGKTFIAQALMIVLQELGKTVVGFKPIAAGCEQTSEGLRNADAWALQQCSSFPLAYSTVNPIAYAKPVAPHLAALELRQTIDLSLVDSAFETLQAMDVDMIITEGAGGWRLPLGDGKFLSDFAVANSMSVILVVPIRLGCLNHAVLTAEAIRRDGLAIAGWVANIFEPNMPLLQENIQSLQQLLAAPLLGEIPHVASATIAADYLDLSGLL